MASLAQSVVDGVVKGADTLGMTGLQSTAQKTLGYLKSGKDFGASIGSALDDRITWKMRQSMGMGIGDKPNNMQRFQSLFYNREGEFQKKRVAGAVAGSYMAANIVGHGSLGIPFISTASWNR